MRDISAWLKDLGLERYVQAFGDNDIDADVLPSLTDADLRELGVASLGHRKKLLAAIAAPERTTAAAIEGERRQVTVLFADLSGFTALSDGADPEAVHDLLNRYFAAVDAALEAHGGRIDKHIGDGVMAVFGAPVAHTDDPLRAVMAAQAIHDAVAGLTTPQGRPVTVHIGVASGEVVASGTGSDAHREYTVIGDSVNLAARLQDRAGAGETLVSDAVRRAVGPAAKLEALGALEIKGLDRGVEAWRVLALGTTAPTTDAFVGRAAELRHLTGALETCQRDARGQAVLIRGEPGIGKTRIMQEVARRAAAAGFACHTGQVTDFGSARGAAALRALVVGLLGVEDAAGDADGLDRAQDDGRFPTEHRPFLNDLLDLAQPPQLRALYEAMDGPARTRGRGAALTHLAATAPEPLLLAVEDVHWAAPETLNHLAGLAAALADRPALLLLTTRLDGDPIDTAWRGRAGATPLTTLDPPPLTHDDAQALAHALGAADAAIDACIARAEGNPLFLEQLVRGFADDAVPGTVQSVVLARVDRLAAADKAALQAAAVLGPRFTLAALRHVAAMPAYAATALLAGALLRPAEDELAFGHALIRDGVYATLLRDRRHDLHARAAVWFAERDDETHAEHLASAADPRAATAFAAAARTQADAFRAERALALAERGLALAADDGTHYALEMLLAQLARDAGEPARAIEHCRTALTMADDDEQRCAACIGVAAGVRLEGGYADGVAALDAAEPLATARDDPLALAQIAYLRGTLQFTVGDIDGCFAGQRAALEHARAAGAPEWEMRAAGGLADAHYARGHMKSARADFQRCIALARQHGFGQIEIDNAFMLGITGRYVGEIAASLEAIADAVAMARRVGNRRALTLSLNCQGELLLESGRFDAARAPFDEALDIVEAMGNRRLLPYMLMNQARHHWVTGDAAAARELLAPAREAALASEPRYVAPRILGLTALAADDPAARAAALDEGEAILARGCTSHNHLWFHRDAIEACLDAGDRDGVTHHAAALEDFTRDEPLAWSDYYVAWGRALAAAGQGSANRADLECLTAQARDLDFALPLPRLEAALAQA